MVPSSSDRRRNASRPPSGSAPSANQPEHHREQLPLDRRAARHPLGERRDVPHGAGRVGVADGREPGLGGLRGEAGLRGRQLGRRGQERPVEQLLVQPPDLATRGTPAFEQPVGPLGPHADRAREPAQVRLGRRQEVRAAQPVELDPVLEHAQQAVADGELRRVVAPDVPARGQRGERGQRAGAADRLVRAPVHQLEQLHRELDVPQPADPELELPVGLRGGHVPLHPPAHRLRVLDEVLARHGAPHERLRHLDVLAPERARPPPAVAP